MTTTSSFYTQAFCCDCGRPIDPHFLNGSNFDRFTCSCGAQYGEALHAAQCGDQRGFSFLYVLHYGALHKFINRHLRDLGVRERFDREGLTDLAQETFLKAWAAIKSFKGLSTFWSWICAIGRNLIANELRRQQATERAEKMEFGKESRPNTLQNIIISEALAALPDRQHEVITLKLGGYKHREIGAELGITTSTSCVSYKQGIANLRRFFGRALA